MTELDTRVSAPTPTHEMVREDAVGLEVRSDAYTAAEIFAAEIARIFEGGWVYVGHVSEIANRGDYRTVMIGRQPMILARGADGEISVLFNRCAHRGNLVCRMPSGNTSVFRCAYHGWVYGLDGTLKGVTARQGYSERALEGLSGLKSAPLVGEHQGLVFTSLTADAPPFEEFIAPIAATIDTWAAKSPVGSARLAAPHRFAYDGNWKFQVENTVDGYHPRFVHESGFKALSGLFEEQPANGDRRNLFSDFSVDRGITRSFPGGHGTLEHHVDPAGSDVGLVHLERPDFEAYMRSLVAAYDEGVAEEVRVSLHLYVFPNLFLMDTNLRVIVPVAPDRSEVLSHFVELDGVEDVVNETRLKDLQARLGTTGLVAPDDMEMFVSMQSALAGNHRSWIPLSRGLENEVVDESGTRTGSYSSETPQREFWREWVRRMGGAPA
jgi:phenylpropionate dioxygenase-like ring-hydroxylating dioxygenase large terminal subunit